MFVPARLCVMFLVLIESCPVYVLLMAAVMLLIWFALINFLLLL